MFNLTEFQKEFHKDVYALVTQKINEYFKSVPQNTKSAKIINIIRLCDLVENEMDGIRRENVMQLIHGLAIGREES